MTTSVRISLPARNSVSPARNSVSPTRNSVSPARNSVSPTRNSGVQHLEQFGVSAERERKRQPAC